MNKLRIVFIFLAMANIGFAQSGVGGPACSGALASVSSGSATPLLVPYIGATGNSALAESSPVLAFGDQEIHTSSTAIPISISNPSGSVTCSILSIGCGTGSLTVSGMAISGTNASDFVLTGSCSSIASGSDCEPTITFTPTASSGTAETATLTVTDNGVTSTQTMSLTGTSEGTVTSLSTSSGPSALSGSTNYQVAAAITNAGTNFTFASTGTDLNLNGYTLTFGNTSTSSQVNSLQSAGFNTQIQVHNGTLAMGAGNNTKGEGHPQSSVFGYTASNNVSPSVTTTFANLTFNYNNEFTNAIENDNGKIVVHDNIFNDSAVGTCGMVGCRNELQAAPIYEENVSAISSGATQYYENTVNGSPQGGMQCAAPGCVIAYNFLNPGNVTGNNSNDFAIWAWGTGAQIHHNVICTPLGANCNTRGIQISAAQTPTLTGVDVYDNIIGAIETPTNTEYGGCQVGGAYGIQFDDDPIGPNTAYSNYVVAYAKSCSGGALRVTMSEYVTNVSHNNIFIASRLSGAPACTRSPDSVPQPGCANASEWDGPTGFTSQNDSFTGDTCDVLLDVSGGSGVSIQSPIFNKGANPSDFHTFCAENGTTSEGGGPVTNFHVVDATFNSGTSATDTDFPQYNVGNQGDVSQYIDWTQTMQVNKTSGPAVSGAVVTWTDTLSNNYTCTTNSSGTCPVVLTQYRNNNDTAANQHENRNPYSLSIPFAGCTTYTQSGITISATGTKTVTLSGC